MLSPPHPAPQQSEEESEGKEEEAFQHHGDEPAAERAPQHEPDLSSAARPQQHTIQRPPAGSRIQQLEAAAANMTEMPTFEAAMDIIRRVPLYKGRREYPTMLFGASANSSSAGRKALASSMTSMPNTTRLLTRLLCNSVPPEYKFSSMSLCYHSGVNWHRDAGNLSLNALVTFGSPTDRLLVQHQSGDVSVMKTFHTWTIFDPREKHSS
eukprot:739712-Amphidinium_carterae.1